MSDTRTVTIPIWRRTKEGAGTGAGNRWLLKRYIERAEALCSDTTFQATVDRTRIAWNEKYPAYKIDPAYPRESIDRAIDRVLGHVGLARATAHARKQTEGDAWESLEPAVNDWYKYLAELHIRTFPPVIWDTGFVEGRAIGMRFIEQYLLRGPNPLKGKCDQHFPTLKEIYEAFAHRVVANGSCLPLDADTTSEDLKDFAKYALPIIRESTVTNETFVGRAIDGLAAADFERRDIAFRLGLKVRTVKARLDSRR